MCGVRWQIRQVECLVHNTLACEGSITVKQNRHHLWNQSTCYGRVTNDVTWRNLVSVIFLHTKSRLSAPSCPRCLHSRTAQLWSSPAPLSPLLLGGTGSPWGTMWCACHWPGSFSCDTFPSDISHHRSPERAGYQKISGFIYHDDTQNLIFRSVETAWPFR